MSPSFSPPSWDAEKSNRNLRVYSALDLANATVKTSVGATASSFVNPRVLLTTTGAGARKYRQLFVEQNCDSSNVGVFNGNGQQAFTHTRFRALMFPVHGGTQHADAFAGIGIGTPYNTDIPEIVPPWPNPGSVPYVLLRLQFSTSQWQLVSNQDAYGGQVSVTSVGPGYTVGQSYLLEIIFLLGTAVYGYVNGKLIGTILGGNVANLDSRGDEPQRPMGMLFAETGGNADETFVAAFAAVQAETRDIVFS